MANFFKNMIARWKMINQDEDEYDEEDFVDNSIEDNSVFAQEKSYKRDSYKTKEEDEEAPRVSSFFEGRRKTDKNNKIVPISRSGGNDMEVCILRPQSAQEANSVSDKLMEGSSVILNLEGIDEREAQRIMDFVFGSMYTLNGKYSKISNYNFVFLPKDVNLQADLGETAGEYNSEEFQSDGSDFEIPIIKRDF